MKPMNRRSLIAGAFASAGLAAFDRAEAAAQQRVGNDAPISPKDNIKITKLETFLVKPRWLFLKVHTNAGIVGLGEPITEGRALTCVAAVKEIEPYLIGKDPRRVAHHWQAIYRHAFYRGGPVLTSALSGIDQALWDIKGKALGVPIYELLGGPTRERVRVYAHGDSPEALRAGLAKGFTAFKTGPAHKRPARYIETPAAVQYAAEQFAELRRVVGNDVDIAIDFHGATSPATAKLLIKALEPYQADVRRGAHQLPGARRDGRDRPRHLSADRHRRAGFHQVGLSRGSGEARRDRIAARHLPRRRHHRSTADRRHGRGLLRDDRAAQPARSDQSLAAGVQMAASIPNFLCQEQVSLGEGYLKKPFIVRNGYLDLPTGPGLGIELDENAMADKIGHDWRNPEAYDADDGAAVDW